MKNDKDAHIVIIGMGFLMGYISPCYEEFVTADNLRSHVAAVTADESSLEEKRREFPFRIILRNNLTILREMHPDIILFAVPPSAAPALAEKVLKIYYDEERAAGRLLPDLYAFPPTPHGKYYLDLLGYDIQVCNILPNMVKEINGVKLNGLEGNSYITFPNESPWPVEKIDRIQRFFAPLGSVVEVKPQHIMEVLATLVATDVMPGAIYTVYDALVLIGDEVPYKDIATIFRNRLQEIRSELPKNKNELIRRNINPEITNILSRYCESWYSGLCDFLSDTGVEENSIHKIVSRKLDIAVHACQEEPREIIEHNSKNHATPDGVLEKGHFVYQVFMQDKLFNTIADYKNTPPDGDFFDWVYNMAQETSKIVTAKGKQLTGKQPPEKFTAETHAAVFGILVRNALKLGGATAQKACEDGVIKYGLQRGARMGRRALNNGDELTMLNYMAYGEWKPDQGQFDIREAARVPSSVSRVYKCPWQMTWEKLGLLKEGCLYCRHIDKNLAVGFSSNIELGINSIQMEGDEYCEFVYNGAELNDENRSKLADKKALLGDSCIKDWEYHSMHLFGTIGDHIKENTDAGEKIIAKTLDDVIKVFGRHAGEILNQAKEIDFTAV